MKRIALAPLALIAACSSTGSLPSTDETARRMTGLEQKFDLFDLNGDGYLSRTELAEGFRSAGNDDITSDDINRVIEFYDRNKDGRISLTEVHQGSDAGPEALLKKFED